MIPKSNEWRSWSALDKATYLAQLLAPVSLIVASVFSYLGWREAHLSQLIQKKLFAAEKGPQLVFSRAAIVPGFEKGNVITVTLKNEGGSPSDGLCLKFYSDYAHAIDGSFCDPKSPFVKVALDPGGETSFLLPVWYLKREKVLSFEPASVQVLDPANVAARCFGRTSAVMLSTVDYADVLGNRRGAIGQILFCGPVGKNKAH